MKRVVLALLAVLVVGGLAWAWLATAGTGYEEDRKTGYLEDIRCDAVGRVYFPVWNGKYWEMGGEASSDASQVIDKIGVESTLEINGSPSASDSDMRNDDDHAETKIVQPWTGPWYEVCYNSTHTFSHHFHDWKTVLLNTRPCYASKGGQP